MKKLDHNEAIKALREDKKINMFGPGYNLNGLTSSEVIRNAIEFLNADYFTLEEPEEKNDLTPYGIALKACDTVGVGEKDKELVNWSELRMFCEAVIFELDKRYQKKER